MTKSNPFKLTPFKACGKERTIATGLPFGKAIRFGQEYVAKTARASFKPVLIGKTNIQDIIPSLNLQMFYQGKGGRFIERSRYRIDQPIEKQEIPYKAAELKRLGLLRRKTKGIQFR